MLAPAPVDHQALDHRGSLIVAHTNSSQRASGDGSTRGKRTVQVRAEALAVALQNALQIVVIQLTSREDSQEIFETLNARGTPLTAADLIKNFVFQRLKSEGVDEAEVYARWWPFETKFWEEEISVGRFTTSRSAVFLSQWLVSRVGKEISRARHSRASNSSSSTSRRSRWRGFFMKSLSRLSTIDGSRNGPGIGMQTSTASNCTSTAWASPRWR